VIASLIFIYLHINKISGKHQFRIASLSKNYVLNLLLDNQHSEKAKPHCFSLENLMSKRHLKLKSLVVDLNNCFNELFFSFDNFHKELSSSF